MNRSRKVPISVSSRVLRHISRGIYRTPAGALKELISNAHDAGARDVTVTTGWPTIEQIVITDNGEGMAESEFVRIVQNIGFSKKSLGDEFTVPGTSIKRKTIGHYGIGLLAVGQLASTMRIVSKQKGQRKGFEAEVDFSQFEILSGGEIERSRAKDEEDVEQNDPRPVINDPGNFKIGQCQLWTRVYPQKDKDASFTRIILTGIREFFHRHLSGELADVNPDWSTSREYSANFQALLKLLRENESTANLGWYPYEKLIWELAVYCPVPYPDIDPFQKGKKLSHIAQLASRHGFNLRVDGILVNKPFEPNFFRDRENPVEEIFSWDRELFQTKPKQKRCSGYLIYKRRIRPKAIQGILVRETGVAIGLYDTTYLHYPFNEGQKFNQLTGEIFADGLSGALNIDRNSFNETDETYLALCQWFHKKLRDEGVFTEIKRLQSRPQSAARVATRNAIQETLELAALENEYHVRSVIFESQGKDCPLLKVRGRKLIINQDHPDGSGSGAKREKVMLAAALVMAGYATPDQIEEMDDLLGMAKKQRRFKK